MTENPPNNLEIERDYTSKIDELESFFDPQHLYNFLTLQDEFFDFLKAIKAIRGASLEVLDNGYSAVFLNGQEVPETRAYRFKDSVEINELLKFAGLQ
ncbi:hypothetical protein [Maribacter sp. 2210JD10-5]|uniref:hypothetical protein n=1 Tax=Maribacter sp. 2210JD10-5 TaxID=3386272 RepID=UPI0039BD2BB1